MVLVIDPALFVKFVLLGLLICGVLLGGWWDLKLLFKWLKDKGM